jgi:hypothetical protein
MLRDTKKRHRRRLCFDESKTEPLRFLDTKGVCQDPGESHIPKWSRTPRLKFEDWTPYVKIGRLRREFEHPDVFKIALSLPRGKHVFHVHFPLLFQSSLLGGGTR